ncbi:hypothetical protein [Nonomuraea maritima]|nr:hypothetical protein [Nonomuraea maritima]
MMYGPTPHQYPPVPEYPRATSSPPIILLVSGLAALLGFLLGLFVGFGAGAAPADPAPRVTVTIEETPPAQPDSGSGAPTQNPLPQDTAPQNTLPQETAPGVPTPGQTPSGTSPGGTDLGGLINPASLRTYVVGRDLQPGTYHTAGPESGFSMCFWARLRGAGGGVLATGMPTGPTGVTIQATDGAFQTGGCKEWTRT